MCGPSEDLTGEDGLGERSEANGQGEKGMRIHVAWKRRGEEYVFEFLTVIFGNQMYFLFLGEGRDLSKLSNTFHYFTHASLSSWLLLPQSLKYP